MSIKLISMLIIIIMTFISLKDNVGIPAAVNNLKIDINSVVYPSYKGAYGKNNKYEVITEKTAGRLTTAIQPTPVYRKLLITPANQKIAYYKHKPENQSNKIPAEIDTHISLNATVYSVDDKLLRKVAECESGFNSAAQNGMYAGLYQFSPSTWESTRIQMNANPDINLRYDPEEAVKTAAYKIAKGGISAWPNCR